MGLAAQSLFGEFLATCEKNVFWCFLCELGATENEGSLFLLKDMLSRSR